MTYQIQVSKEAEKDLAIAKCHYKSSRLEIDFSNDFVKQIEYLKANPYLFQIWYKDIRKVHFEAFKYAIHYFIKNKTVYILRILSHRQEFK